MKRNAQAIIEYTMVLIIVAAALLLMMHYIKRGTAGRLRKAADSIGEQYDAHNVTADITYTHSGNVTTLSTQEEIITALAEDGRVYGVRTTTDVTNEVSNRSGDETLSAFPAINALFD